MKARVNIYGEIGTEVKLSTVAAQVPKGATEVFVHINSIGGDVSEGYAIHNYLKGLNAKVTTIIEGACYSIATVIALSGDTRKMFPTAEIMIHNPWGSVQGEADEIRKYSEWIKRTETELTQFYSSRLSLSADNITKQMKETTFIDATKALQMGFITEPANEFKAVAKINHTIKTASNMELNEKDKNWLSSQFSKLQNAFNPAPAKAMLELGIVTEGGEIEVYVDTEDGEVEGKSVYLDAEMTRKAPEGVHLLKDGREITVDAEGVITAVSEASETESEAKSDTSAMEKENEELKAKIAAMEEEMKTSQAMAKAAEDEKEEAVKASAKYQQDIATAKETIAAIKARFEPMLNSKPGKGGSDPKPEDKSISGKSLFEIGAKSLINKN